jgi:hypothetical protein
MNKEEEIIVTASIKVIQKDRKNGLLIGKLLFYYLTEEIDQIIKQVKKAK